MVSNDTFKTESEECKMRSVDGYCPRPLEAVSSFLSKKWTISIITTIGNFQVLRFNEIEHRIEGITPKTLTDRLRELEKEGIVKRSIYAEIPPRVEYSLTRRGMHLRKAIIPLIKWAEKRGA